MNKDLTPQKHRVSKDSSHDPMWPLDCESTAHGGSLETPALTQQRPDLVPEGDGSKESWRRFTGGGKKKREKQGKKNGFFFSENVWAEKSSKV